VDVIFRTAGTDAQGQAVELLSRRQHDRTHVTCSSTAFENVGQMRLGLPPAGFF
jgi:hypothetical protein